MMGRSKGPPGPHREDVALDPLISEDLIPSPAGRGPANEPRPSFLVETFLVAFAAIVLEIAMTRIFSFKLYYYFTYLILGIAMLGLGTGGALLAVHPALRNQSPQRLIARCCAGAAVVVPLTYAVIALVQLNVSDLTSSAGELGKLFLICFSLFSPFLLVGIVLASIFGSRAADMNRLYFVDLLGAGIGCGLCVPLFLTVTPPGAVLVGGAVLGVAAVHCARGVSRPLVAVGAVSALLLAVLAVFPSSIPQPVPDRHKTMSPQRHGNKNVLFSDWSAVFRVDVVETPNDESMHTLHHDGNIGSSLRAWDGTSEKLRRFSNNIRSLPFKVLDPGARVLVIGAAGGQELMASLFFEAEAVTGVELNPLTVSLLTDQFAEFTGRVAHHPRVTLVNAEGRSFLERNNERYDLIWLVAPDSYAAMNAASSGAFVLSESYLYTVEMIESALEHLTPGGVLCAQFGELHLLSRPNRTPRYVATAREALTGLGISEPGRHIIVSTAPAFLPGSTTLVSRQPFSDERVERLRLHLQNIENSQLWYPMSSPAPRELNPVQRIISLDGGELDDFYASYDFNVRPIHDDSPFFWHFTGFRDAVFGSVRRDPHNKNFEVAIGERMLVLLLVFAASFAAIFILLPTVWIRDIWSEIPYKRNVGLYFAALGLGFMFIEVCLIQKLTLFLGYPSYSLTVTLFSLLIFSGLGSLLSARYSESKRQALLGLLLALGVLTVFFQYGVTPLTRMLESAGLAQRIGATVAMLAPVGLCLGAFMPIGVATISQTTSYQKQYVAWAWAVNGFFSVVGSVSATILAMSVGFRWLLFIALLVYAVGIVALRRIPIPSPRPRSSEA